MQRSGRIETLIAILEKEPEDLFTNYALGIEYSNNTSELYKAEEQFKKVLGLDPDYIPAYYQLGKLFESQTKIPDALTYFKKGLELARIQKNNKAINEFNEAVFLLED